MSVEYLPEKEMARQARKEPGGGEKAGKRQKKTARKRKMSIPC